MRCGTYKRSIVHYISGMEVAYCRPRLGLDWFLAGQDGPHFVRALTSRGLQATDMPDLYDILHNDGGKSNFPFMFWREFWFPTQNMNGKFNFPSHSDNEREIRFPIPLRAHSELLTRSLITWTEIRFPIPLRTWTGNLISHPELCENYLRGGFKSWLDFRASIYWGRFPA